MKKFLIIISAYLISGQAFSQDWFSYHEYGETISAYVLGMAGDTIKGTLRYDYPIVMQKRIYFNPAQGTSNREEYTPDNLIGYSVDGKSWFSTTAIMETFNGPFKFKRFGMLESVPGPVSLVRIFDEEDKLKKKINSAEAEKKLKNILLNYPENSLDYLYIKKNEGDAESLDSKTFKRFFVSKMRSYVGDYEALMQKIETKKYRLEDLKKIVAEYNQWYQSKRYR